MNINNQLEINSNVGQVKEKAKTTNIKGVSIESVMPLASGPIINETVAIQNQEQQQNNINQIKESIQNNQQPQINQPIMNNQTIYTISKCRTT